VVQSVNPVNKEPSLTVWVLGLLARMLPSDQRNEPTQAEALYLKQYEQALVGVPENLGIIAGVPESPRSVEQNLIALLGKEDVSAADVMVLMLCFLVETDAMVGRCVAYLQQPMGGSRPTLSLLAAMVHEAGLADGQSTGTVMAGIVHSTAAQSGLLEVQNSTATLPEQCLKLHTPVVLNLSGSVFSWPGASLSAPGPVHELPASIARQAALQARALVGGDLNTLVVRSSSERDKRIVAHYIARSLGRHALYIEDQDKALTALGPVSQLKSLLPILQCECGPGDRVNLPEIAGYQGPVLVLAGLDGAVTSRNGRVTSWVVPRPTRDERRSLWETYLGHHALAERLAVDHVNGMDRIIELTTLAKRQALLQEKEKVGVDDLLEAAWSREGKGISSLAQPVKTKVGDTALVVRPQTEHQLQLLEKRCRLREGLADDLGVTLRARYQMGVKALFTGPSGTGKTLAASWLANRLGLPLYRVDLASVTSKYVGETEKNLSELLGRAEQEDVILLFDEADALFSKRTEVKDANDRFANAQTNYLLQRIEYYGGVVLLTSNSKARFDAAFTRRLDMIIDFPLPGPEERRAIWLSHLGSFHSLSKGNINQLAAQCDLCGGYIRNVVLTAAVIAKHGARKITMEDLIAALADEYHKLGKQLPQELKNVKRED
jgi:hypothetical protein